MSTRREPGAAYALWWLFAVLVLPVIDVAAVVVINGAIVSFHASAALPLALVVTVLLNIVCLGPSGRRLGASTATIASAVGASLLAGTVAFLIFVYFVIAPALA